MSNLLNGFDYVTYLTRLGLIGKVYPWRINDPAEPIYTTMVPLQTAILECSEWSGEEITRKDFLKYLRNNDIAVFNDIDDFVELREKHKAAAKGLADLQPQKKPKREYSDEERKMLSERMKKINSSRSTSKKKPSGNMTEDLTEPMTVKMEN